VASIAHADGSGNAVAHMVFVENPFMENPFMEARRMVVRSRWLVDEATDELIL
jgi:hypothetical protein